MTAPLTGLRVLDLTSGPAGGLATMILSDFGAHVQRFVDPGYAELNDMPSARMWLRGKEAASIPVHEAVASADIVVISTPNGFSGCDYPSIQHINPAVIYAEVRGIPAYPEIPVSEPVVAAHMGRMMSMAGILKEPGPRYAVVPVATHATSQNLVTGILAALYERNRSGVGQMVSTSLAAGLIPYDQGASLAMQARRKSGAPEPVVDMGSVMPTLNYHPVQCADGKWIQLGNLLPHLFKSFMQAIGLEAEMSKLPDGLEEVRDAILKRMQTRTADEWMSLFVRDGGIAAHPWQTAGDALDDPDMRLNGHVVELNGVTQLGPLARLTETPAEIEHRRAGEPQPLPAPDPVPPRSAPLRGVTVIELATIIAAPLAASFLADLGARVIKVEVIGGDPYRKMGGGVGAMRCNQGKESIGVDLKSEDGKTIVHKLVAMADIVIHNFRPGVPARLGIDYEALRTIKPGIIYLSANGYGPDGPGAMRPSTHPIPGAAMGGAGQQAGGVPSTPLDLPGLRETARRLMRANEVNPDPNTAMVICTSALLGLIARERHGTGQQIFGDMFIANAYANFDDMIAFDGKQPRPPLLPDLTGVDALHALYPCKEGIVFLAIDRTSDWVRFCEIVGQEHLLSHYPSPLPAPPAALIDELGVLFRHHSARYFEELLAPRGVPCVVADHRNLTQTFFDACHTGSSWMVPVEDQHIGAYFRHRPMMSFSRARLSSRPAVRGGANTRSLMAELGYARDETEALYAANVLWSEEPSTGP